MTTYHKASICLNGHVMSKYDSNVQPFCSSCGEKIISVCPNCNAPIHGEVDSEGIVMAGFIFNPDKYCYNCGEPYPWVQRLIDASKELLELDDNSTQESVDLIIKSLPDLIVSSPKKEVAKAKFKKGLKSFSSFTKDSLQNILSDVLSEAIKKYLFES